MVLHKKSKKNLKQYDMIKMLIIECCFLFVLFFRLEKSNQELA